MTTQELHIELDLLLQKVSSNWNSNFLPQEVDVFINREIYKYLKTRIRRESNEKGVGIYDVLKRIYDTNDSLTEVVIPLENENQEAKATLPLDFFYYIESNAKLNCTSKGKKQNFTVYNPSIPDISLIYPDKLKDIIKYKIILEYNGENQVLFDIKDVPPNYYPAGNRPDSYIEFIYNNSIYNSIVRRLVSINIGITATHNLTTKRFDFSGNVPFQLIIEYQMAGDVTKNLTGMTSSIIRQNYILEDYVDSPVDIIDEEYKTKIRNSYLSSSSDEILKGTLKSKIIKLNLPTKLVVEALTLTYIAKPFKVDVLLGYNSNLKEEVLIEIIHNVARTIKGVISSDTYDKFARENTLLE